MNTPAQAQADTLPDPLPPLLLSDLQVARLLSCSRRQIWRLSAAGFLPNPTRIPGIGTRWPYQAVRDTVDRLFGGAN